MTPQQWQRVKSVLTEAPERKREEQSAFLDRACSAEPWLRGKRPIPTVFTDCE
jgi:hypothetical protein